MPAPFLEMDGKNRVLGGQSYSNKYFQTKQERTDMSEIWCIKLEDDLH